MPANTLLDAIRTAAEKERLDIRTSSENEAAAIRADADAKTHGMREKAVAAIQAEAERLRERKYNAIRFSANARRYALKSEAIAGVWNEAAAILDRVGKGPDYPRIVAALFDECLPAIPDHSVVRVHPDDAAVIEGCIARADRPIQMQVDTLVHGGVEFVWPDGRTVLRNTLSARLDRLKGEGNEAISALLFAGEDDHT